MQVERPPLDLGAVPALQPRRAFEPDVAEGSYVVAPDDDAGDGVLRPGAHGYSRRLTAAFNDLFYSLCDRRLDYIPREHDPSGIPGAYEFPREFRKIRNTLVQLLVDLCRPSQLQVSPFLRGFYFSGVRPVVLSEAAATPAAAAPAAKGNTFKAGATRMFRT